MSDSLECLSDVDNDSTDSEILEMDIGRTVLIKDINGAFPNIICDSCPKKVLTKNQCLIEMHLGSCKYDTKVVCGLTLCEDCNTK